MRRARPAFSAPLFLGLLLASGCYGPYRSPYGAYPTPAPYGYPAQGAPVQTLQPGGTYTPYGQPMTPYGSTPQGTFSQPTPIDQTGGDAPFYGNGGSSTQPYDGGGVPKYTDPNEVQFNKQPIEPDNTALGEYGALEGASAETAAVAKVDIDTAEFVAPVITAAAGPPVATFADTPATPFAFDSDYAWLRGVLRFDAAGGWTMIYSDNPAADDEHAGRIAVADSPLLEPLKPQAVVLLRGRVDQTLSSASGRATYRVDAVEPVELSLP